MTLSHGLATCLRHCRDQRAWSNQVQENVEAPQSRAKFVMRPVRALRLLQNSSRVSGIVYRASRRQKNGYCSACEPAVTSAPIPGAPKATRPDHRELAVEQ